MSVIEIMSFKGKLYCALGLELNVTTSESCYMTFALLHTLVHWHVLSCLCLVKWCFFTDCNGCSLTFRFICIRQRPRAWLSAYRTWRVGALLKEP